MSRGSLCLLSGAVVIAAALGASLAAGCGGTTAVPPSAPTVTSVATTGAAVVPTVAAAATAVAPTLAAAAPTVAAAATSAAPTVSAAVTAAAPTVAAGAAAVGPTVSAAATSVAGAAAMASSTTVGQLADSGKTVFASNCASCHGAEGQGGVGPAIIGPSANLAKYDTALGLFTKISTTMPRSRPASLTPDQCLQVTSYLLVQNNLVQPSATLSSIQFGAVPLKK